MSHLTMMSSLTKRLAQTSIAKTTTVLVGRNPSLLLSSSSSMQCWKAAASVSLLNNNSMMSVGVNALPLVGTRWMSSGGKKKTSSSSSSSDLGDSSNTQHEEWVKFQQSIAVEGFNTGQTTKVTSSGLTGRKGRGGKQLRKRKQKELELQKREDEFASMGGGQFPTLRYSDEETERLLRQAYAAIPPKAGPRKSRHLKRERIRWWRVRKARKVLKKQRIAAHYRRMEKRSRIIKDVLAVKDGAEEVRKGDEEYQKEIMKQWVLRSLLVEEKEESKREMLQVEGGDGGGQEEKEEVEAVGEPLQQKS